MPLPPSFEGRLRLPVIAAPMFLASGPEMVLACCRAGIVGSFPAKNQRTREGLDEWLTVIGEGLAAIEAETGRQAPPFGVTGPRFYVSITAAAATHFGGYDSLPPMPASLRASLRPPPHRKG